MRFGLKRILSISFKAQTMLNYKRFDDEFDWHCVCRKSKPLPPTNQDFSVIRNAVVCLFFFVYSSCSMPSDEI